jgi:hypothetical protein
MVDRARRKSGSSDERDKRLAEALRANLKRRKTQQRQRGDGSGPQSGEPTPPAEITGEPD